jgi:hypothetical protein
MRIGRGAEAAAGVGVAAADIAPGREIGEIQTPRSPPLGFALRRRLLLLLLLPLPTNILMELGEDPNQNLAPDPDSYPSPGPYQDPGSVVRAQDLILRRLPLANRVVILFLC